MALASPTQSGNFSAEAVARPADRQRTGGPSMSAQTALRYHRVAAEAMSRAEAWRRDHRPSARGHLQLHERLIADALQARRRILDAYLAARRARSLRTAAE
jgi:hypothetical protein